MSGLFAKWGFGAELVFDVGRGLSNMAKARAGVGFLRRDFQKLKEGAQQTVAGLGMVGMALAPVGLAFGLVSAKASGLAADLEANALTMEVLIGSTERAAQHMQALRDHAAATPFQLADIIDGSKRLMRLTGDNLELNMEQLQVMETMAALDPTKSVQDAVEGLLDAASGGGFERLKEFGISFKAEDFAAAGRPGGEAWGAAVMDALEEEVTRRTRGQDLVGKLAQTFTGRMSTFKDGIDNLLTDVGARINERAGGMLTRLTDQINAAKPMIVAAVGGLFEQIERAGSALEPVITKMGDLWQSLSPEQQQGLVQAAISVGALAGALVPLGGALGLVGLGVGGIATAMSGLGTMGTAVGSMLLGAWTNVGLAIGNTVGGFQAALAAMGVMNPVVGGIAGALAAVGVAVLLMGVELDKLWQGFAYVAGPAMAEAFETVKEPAMELWATLSGLFAELMPATGDFSDAWFNIGAAFGWLLGVVSTIFAGIIKVVILAVETMVTTFGPFLAVLANVRDALLGWIQGTATAEEAFTALAGGLVGVLGGLINGILGVLAFLIEGVLTIVGTMLEAVPGLGGMGEILAGKAQSVGEFRRGFSEAITEGIRKTADGLAAERRTEAEVATDPTADFGTSEIVAEVDLVSTVEVDRQELAKTQGRQAVRAGERGTGPKLPAEQGARVLRRGLDVTPLRRAEAL